MPATTAGGLPYPLPTEQAKDGADAIKNLANALQTRGVASMVQSGTAVVTSNQAGDCNITPTTPFKAGTSPIFLVAPSDPLGPWICVPNSAATTNTVMPFRIYMANTGLSANNFGPFRVSWLAIGVAP